MSYLVDTHVWLWLILQPERLANEVVSTLADESNAVYLSAVSAHEIVIKHALGKLALPEDPRVFIPRHVEASGVTQLPIGFAHALEVSALPPLHRDPFDRLLVAQARCEGMTLVTGDAAVMAYAVKTQRAWAD